MKTFFQKHLLAPGKGIRAMFRKRKKGGSNPNEIFIFYALLPLLLLLPEAVGAQKVTAVTGVSITVGDLDSEVDFFVKNLDFKKIKEEKWTGGEAAKLFGLSDKNAVIRVATLQLGSEQIRLLDFDSNSGAPVAAAQFNRQTRSNDLWFQHLAIVVRDMDAAYQKLLKNKVTHVSTSPQTLPDYLPNAAGIQAFYFRDPEGHNLELIWFPPGKGAARWQSAVAGATGSGNTPAPKSTPPILNPQSPIPVPLFLGIDHTAVGISDTEESMAFYRDQLGLVHGGHSENYGTEQEHLNQVFGARLDINGLHADAGFGVEFLRYIAPPGGRPCPADSAPTDLWHYQTELEVDDLSKMLEKLEKQGLTKISGATAKLDGKAMFLLRDPDGHAVLLQEKEKG